jgi:ribulose-bisphosphate carboxylase large chain
VATAAQERGRSCLYVPHITGPFDVMLQRAEAARAAGAGGLLLCPGLTGFDTLRRLSEATGLPILSHPSLLGSLSTNQTSGIAPWLIFGRLTRLAGADATLYPSFDRGFPMSIEDCRRIAEAARAPWGPLKPILPTAAGRIGADEVRGMAAFYGRDVLFILGSRVQQDADGVVDACRRFMREVERCLRKG